MSFRSFASIALVSLALGACTAPRTPGAQCNYSSECAAGLVCTAGVCRSECLQDRDCPGMQRCTSSGQQGVRVCVPLDTARPCQYSSECPAPSVCLQGSCRAMCAADRDCQLLNPRSVCRADRTCSEPVLVGDDVPAVIDAAPDAIDDLGNDGMSETSAMDVADTRPVDVVDDRATDAVDIATDNGCFAPTRTRCGATCVNEQDDPLNCGGCDRVCGTGELCSLGACESSAVRAVCAGGDFTCVVMNSSRSVRCFGRNDYGQIGAPATTALVDGSFRVPGLPRATAIACGNSSACALTEAGDVWCWGDNRSGQLGDGTTTSRHSAAMVVGLSGTAAQVSVGRAHACARTTGGALHCWGSGSSGELGSAAPDGGLATTPVVQTDLSRENVLDVSAALTHTCAITGRPGPNGLLKCWGNTFHLAAPVGRMPSLVWSTEGVDVGLGTSFGCTVADLAPAGDAGAVARGVFCWGGNSQGSLGNPVAGAESRTPVRAGALENVQLLAVGSQHSCALHGSAMTPSVSCWGHNSLSQCGVAASTLNVTTPASVTVPDGARQLAAGYSHSCAINAMNVLYCWGGNAFNALGRTTMSSTALPIPVVF